MNRDKNPRFSAVISVFAAIVVAFFIAILFNSVGLNNWARRLSVGPTRQILYDMTNRLESLTDKVGLNRPRAAIKDFFAFRMEPNEIADTEVAQQDGNQNNAAPAQQETSQTQVTEADNAQVDSADNKLAETNSQQPHVHFESFTQLDPNLVLSVQSEDAMLISYQNHLSQESATNPANAEQNTTNPNAKIKNQNSGDNDASAPSNTPQEATSDKKDESQTSPCPSGKPSKVLLLGDSMMNDVGPSMQRIIGKDSAFAYPALVKKVSSGLSRDDFFNWPKKIKEVLQKDTYDIAVVMIGTNDGQGFIENGKVVSYGSAEWETTYQERTEAVIDLLCEKVGHIFWIGMPRMRTEKFDTTMQLVTRVHQQAVEKKPCASYVVTKDILSNENGEYTSYLLIDGKRKEVRKNDGIHFTLAGSDLIAGKVYDAMVDYTTKSVSQAQ
jgi:hypothetical protein